MADQFRTDRVDWEDVRFFLALARHGSLSAAARALGVNHATVARRVAGLAQALGVALIERRPDGYQLTAAGRAALDAAGGMAAAAEVLTRLETPEGPTGLVRITATPGMVDGYLVPRLAALQAHHRGLDIELIGTIRSLSLVRRETDIALRLGRPQDGDMIARRVARLGFGFYAAPAWRDRLAAGEPPRFVGFDEDNAQVPEAVWLARRFQGARLAFRSNSQLSQAAAARAGGGVAVLPHFLATTTSGLVPVAPAEPPPARELWLLTRRDTGRSPALRTIAEALATLFRRDRRLFEEAPE